MTHEYIIECDQISGDVWSPRRLFAVDGMNDRVIRCAECGLHGRDSGGMLTCRRWPESIHRTPKDGYCHAGVVMADGD